MKILMMLPAAKGVYPPEAEERRLNLMRSYATASTQIDAEYMPGVSGFAPMSGGPATPEAVQRAHELGADMAQKAEQMGYDAYCPYGTLEIGIAAARRRGVKIPCVGQSEACNLFLGMLGRKFASCSYMPETGDPGPNPWPYSKEWGADHLLVVRTAIGIPNREYPQRRAEVLQNFLRCTREARAAGAELMGIIAMSICPTEFTSKELSEASGFPVLDAMACQIALAEWWHRTGLPPSLTRSPFAVE